MGRKLGLKLKVDREDEEALLNLLSSIDFKVPYELTLIEEIEATTLKETCGADTLKSMRTLVRSRLSTPEKQQD